MREMPLVKTMAPGSTLIILLKTNLPCCNLFTLKFIYLPLSGLILAINEFKGLDNPLARVGCKYLLLCVQVMFTRCLHGSPIGLINLGSLLREILIRYYIASPFLFGENPNAAHN
jgi:hypothetical protein